MSRTSECSGREPDSIACSRTWLALAFSPRRGTWRRSTDPPGSTSGRKGRTRSPRPSWPRSSPCGAAAGQGSCGTGPDQSMSDGIQPNPDRQERSLIAAVVLAAGTSSRLGRPKQLLELRGRPLLQHAVDAAFEAGIGGNVVGPRPPARGGAGAPPPPGG